MVGKGPPLGSVGWFWSGWAESDPPVVGVSEDFEASFVDDNSMVEPAKGDQIFRVGGSASTPGDDVMDLETVTTVTAVGAATVSVAVEDGPTQCWWDGPGLAAISHWGPVLVSGGDLGDRIAENRFQSSPADPWSGFQYHSCLTVGWCGVFGLDEYRDLGWWWIIGYGQFDQSCGPSPGAVASGSVGECG